MKREQIVKVMGAALLALGLLGAWAEYTADCITFTSEGGFTLKTENVYKNWDGTLWTSTDKVNWTEWNGAEVSAAQMGGMGDYNLYVRGDANNTKITGGNNWQYRCRWVLTGSAGIACTGNIETLRGATGNQPSSTKMVGNCYRSMFEGCTSLTSAPALPATNLAEGCYWSMFQGCTSLTSASVLPATTLAECCYVSMFWDCTSLTSAPALPATELAESCYSSMHRGCTSLTAAPVLPATTLSTQCYEGMFYGCTSLTSAPALPATDLAEGCYWSMFYGCTSLMTAPALSATTLAEGCYEYMFEGCTSLTAAPALPATTLANGCYYEMFKGCTSLMSVPTLPATTLAGWCYAYMFSGCASLTNAPALPAMTLAGWCYREMFKGCTSLMSVPTLPATTLAEGCYNEMFRACTTLAVNTVGPGEKWKMSATCTTTDWGTGMFADTGGDFTGVPEVGKTYYVGAEKTELAGGFTARVYDGDCTITGSGELTNASVIKNAGVTNLVIGAGVTGIGAGVFEGWRSLRDVTVGADCTTLGAKTFYKCYNVTNVTCEATGMTIGDYTFLRCNSLERLTFAGMPTWGETPFTLHTAISMDGGMPDVYAVPEVTVSGYKQVLRGSADLTTWYDITTEQQKKDYNFFKIELRAE